MILLLIFVLLAALSAIMIFGIPGSPDYIAWKLSGVWKNQSDTLHIMIHEENACLHGHVVSADIRGSNDKIVIGKMVIDKVKLNSMWQWSIGKYIDPYTMEEFELKIKLKGTDRLKVCYLENENLVRKEEWKLVS
ncbi:MAG TPA: hypothetical protein DIS90_06020 [Cytophagales bacterium]|nr:hypothetical protein [Cytophagales bacterium]